MHPRWLIPRSRQETPIGAFTGTAIKPKIALAPVLRAGLGMTDALLNLFPCVSPLPSQPNCPGIHTLTPVIWIRAAQVYHLGIFREKVTLQPVECMSLTSARSRPCVTPD